MITEALILFFAYLLGSIPFGLLISKLFRIDLREHGSGNIGATNALRILGVGPGILVLILDLLKGTIPVLLAIYFINIPIWNILAGIAAILGHMFPVFLKFRGGRGVATGLGVILGITPDLFLIVFLFAVVVIAITRYVSLGSILGSILLSVLMFTFYKPLEYAYLTSAIAIFIVLKHLPNIKRLLSGTESKIGEKKK